MHTAALCLKGHAMEFAAPSAEEDLLCDECGLSCECSLLCSPCNFARCGRCVRHALGQRDEPLKVVGNGEDLPHAYEVGQQGVFTRKASSPSEEDDAEVDKQEILSQVGSAFQEEMDSDVGTEGFSLEGTASDEKDNPTNDMEYIKQEEAMEWMTGLRRAMVADLLAASTDSEIFHKAAGWWTAAVLHDVPAHIAADQVAQGVEWVRDDGTGGWHCTAAEWIANLSSESGEEVAYDDSGPEDLPSNEVDEDSD